MSSATIYVDGDASRVENVTTSHGAHLRVGMLGSSVTAGITGIVDNVFVYGAALGAGKVCFLLRMPALSLAYLHRHRRFRHHRNAIDELELIRNFAWKVPLPAAGTSGYALHLAKETCVRFPPVVDLATMALSSTFGFTVELWVKPRKLSNGQTMTLVDFPGQLTLEIFYSLADGSARVAVVVEGAMRWESDAVIPQYDSDPSAGVWTKIAVVIRQQKVVLCIDGLCNHERLLSVGNLGLRASTSGHYWYVGAKAGAKNFFEGHLDEVRVWDLARSVEFLQDSASAPHAFRSKILGNEPGLRAVYHFDEGYGTVAANAAPVLGSYGKSSSVVAAAFATRVKERNLVGNLRPRFCCTHSPSPHPHHLPCYTLS